MARQGAKSAQAAVDQDGQGHEEAKTVAKAEKKERTKAEILELRK